MNNINEPLQTYVWTTHSWRLITSFPLVYWEEPRGNLLPIQTSPMPLFITIDKPGISEHL